MQMTPQQREQKIESYGNAYNLLVDEIKKFPEDMWKFKPAPGKWSIHEIIIHLADSETSGYIRCRRFIAEPGSKVLAYDQDKWCNKLNYHQQSTEDALELFKFLREMSYNLIRSLPDPVWANVIEHSENGLMTMEDWLAIYEAHVPVHLKQMQRNYATWKEVNP